MTVHSQLDLNNISLDFRLQLIKLLYSIQSGHPGGSLSATEILVVLYYSVMNVNPDEPNMEGRDRFVLSKGHAAPMLYITLANKGFFPKHDLQTLRQIDSHLQGHPCAHKTPGVEISTGPLGIGFSAALGIALSIKLKQGKESVYALLGDGELQEGVVWETAMCASKYQADNLIAIIDNNGVQLDGTLNDIMPLGSIRDKFCAFGWNVIECNGHSVADLLNAFKEAKKTKNKPSVIIAHTIKGKGVSFMEGENIWHGKPINDVDYVEAVKELQKGIA